MTYTTSEYELAPDLSVDFKRCLFLDNELVHEVRNVRRVFHHPKKHSANPLIVQDRPWENAVWFHVSNFSVVFDHQEGLFKCFYEDQQPHADSSQHWLYDLHSRSRLLLAVSEDGLRWEKPTGDRFRSNGDDTNIVFDGGDGASVHSASVLCDPHDPNPDRRYKMLYSSVRKSSNLPKRNRSPSPHSTGLHAAFSSDGRHWVPGNDNPILPWAGDVTILTFDPQSKVYTITGRADNPHVSSHPDLDLFFLPFRPNAHPGQWVPKRHVYSLESSDFIHWSRPRLILAPDQTDNLDDEHYGLVPWRMDDYRLGLLSVFHTVTSTVDMELVYSMDGASWRRFTDRSPIIPLGGPGAYDAYMADSTSPPITVGEEQWIYYGASRRHHDWWVAPPVGMEAEPTAGMTSLALATIRSDGWVSLSAREREGYVETRPLFSTGSKIQINARCNDRGYVACEVTDYWGNVWPGFERTNAISFTGDAIAHQLTWKDDPQVNMVPGNVRIRFFLKDADLYSFQFVP